MREGVQKDTAREYWLFQYTEGAHVERRFEHSEPGEVTPWKLTRYISRMKPGDIVFFWRAGKAAGLKGWGIVDGPPQPSPGETFKRVPVRVVVNLGDVIPRDEVRAAPEVSDLSVIAQGQQGTNFAVSTRQAMGLVRLLRERGAEAPDVSDSELTEGARRRLARDLSRLREWNAQALEPALVGAADEVLERLRHIAEEGRGVDPETLATAARFAVSGAPPSAPQLRTLARELYGDLAQMARSAGAGADEAPDRPEALVAEPETIGPPEPPVEPSPPAHLPSDDPWIWDWQKQDRVGIGEPIHNLARYVAHRDLVPPKAIGLFGDWGAGKTFFMKALQSQIAVLSWKASLAQKSSSTRPVFCGRVVQVEFNAWHFVESNLWASLAGHLFEQLHDALIERAPGKDVDVDAVFRALATYREAAEEVERIESRIRQIETVEIPALEERERTRRNRWVTETTEFGKALRAELARQFQDPNTIPVQDQERLRELLHVEDFGRLAHAREDVERVAEEARTVLGRMSLYIRSWKPRHYWLAAGTLVVVALAGPWLIRLLDSERIPEVSAVMGTYVAMATGALTFLAGKGRGVLHLVNRGLGVIDDATARVNEQKGPAVAAAEAELAAAVTEREAAQRRMEARKQELDDVRTRFQEQNVGTQLRNFLEDRVRSRAYEQHLGLISLVRRDFEHLSDIMASYWKQQARGVQGAAGVAIDESGRRLPFIERIVLYIDDLDRCPPAKVLEVLQAVHLMLGFKLFVVVVAADVRWIGRSLVEAYPSLLAGDTVTGDGAATNGGRGGAGQTASADDYLEKIFQIPFRIPPLDSDAQERLVSGVLEERLLPGWATDEAMEAPTLDLNPSELPLYPEEKDAILALHSCLGRTPRTVKRFVDLYRLMRAGMSEGDVEVIMRTGQYHAILSVLALLSGSARCGPAIISALHTELRPKQQAPETSYAGWLADYLRGSEGIDPWEARSATAVVEYLDRAAPDAERKAAMRDALLSWVPEAVRYSFREVRLYADTVLEEVG